MASTLHRDHLGSVRAITNATGARVESAIYKSFGEQTEFVTPGLAAPETKGWIGQRYDADAGLQYLNARYYDPSLGLFLQPDWFEVLRPGVGTNRFSYSFNDPVNMSDPTGNDSFGSGNPYSGYDTDNDGVSRFVGGWTRDTRGERDHSWRDPNADAEGRGGPTGYAGYGLAVVETVFYGTRAQIIARAELIEFGSQLGGQEVAGLSGYLNNIFTLEEALSMATTGSINAQATGSIPQFGRKTYRGGHNETTMDHIMRRHSFNSGASNVSRFGQQMDQRNIESHVIDALHTGTRSPALHGGFKYEKDFGYIVGTDKYGAPTSRIRVIEENGYISTAYPY